MSLDFTRLGRASAADTSTEPRTIFNALPSKSAKYGYPWAGQTEVWERWHERRNEGDLVVKMNTGSGKTVVGLLILKSCLNEGTGPTVYVSPDSYLREQVQAEATALGLETADDPHSPRFQQSKAILITNIYRLVNGQSVFGVTGDSRQPIELGTVLIDDVHACLETVEDQFTLTLRRDHPAYGRLLNIFSEDLAAQSAPQTQDLMDGFGYPQLQIPHWAWTDRRDAVLAALQPHRAENALKFAWPLISECLGLCRVGVTNEAIEIKPPVPPIHRIPSLANARRRIYLTATLPDDSVLVTHFNARPDSIAAPVTGKTADDLGDRMILTPLETHPDATEAEIQKLLQSLAHEHNVVVIVPSRRRADAWRPVANQVHDRETIQAGVEALRSGHVGLVVLINKYDGVDLPGAACRILAIDGVPEAYSPLDRIEAVTIGDTEALTTRQIQRIEQGMGRGVRSSTDYCVVMLLGARLTQRLNSSYGYARLSPATRAQIDLSRRVAEMLHGRPLSELKAVIDQCLGRDAGWVTASRAALTGVAYETKTVISGVALAQRQAFDLAEMGRPREAFERMRPAIDGTSDPRLRGWLKQQAGSYIHPADPVEAQRIQTSAQGDNRSLLKPRAGVEYVRLKGSTNQASRSANYLAGTYDNGIALQLGMKAVLDDLIPDPDAASVEKFEQAVHVLGEHLGFESQRPERDNGSGPDVLWKVGDLRFFVIECKSGVTTEFIAKNDASQLSGSVDWFREQYDPTCQAVPVMIHRAAQLHDKAAAREGMRIITFEKLAQLRAAVEKFARAVAPEGAYSDAMRVGEQLEALDLTAQTIVNRWSTEPKH